MPCLAGSYARQCSAFVDNTQPSGKQATVTVGLLWRIGKGNFILFFLTFDLKYHLLDYAFFLFSVLSLHSFLLKGVCSFSLYDTCSQTKKSVFGYLKIWPDLQKTTSVLKLTKTFLLTSFSQNFSFMKNRVIIRYLKKVI